jgi:hypothetical protein
MARTYVGPVRGGNRRILIPGSYLDMNATGAHAAGRIYAMQDLITNFVYLKSKGIIPNGAAHASIESNLTLVGADFQDFRGVRGAPFVMAHRAVGTVHIGNRNVAEFVAPLRDYWDGRKGDPISKPSLLHLIVSPQAQTDAIPRLANYSDTYLERYLKIPLTLLLDRMLAIQKGGRSLEKGALVEELNKLRELIAAGCAQAIRDLEEKRIEDGWAEGGSVPGWDATLDLDKTLDQSFDSTAPTTQVDSDRRPKETGEAPQIFLEATRTAGLQLPGVTEGTVSDAVALLDDARRD